MKASTSALASESTSTSTSASALESTSTSTSTSASSVWLQEEDRRIFQYEQHANAKGVRVVYHPLFTVPHYKRGPKKDVTSVIELEPDGSLLTACLAEGTIKRWTRTTGTSLTCIQTFEGIDRSIDPTDSNYRLELAQVNENVFVGLHNVDTSIYDLRHPSPSLCFWSLQQNHDDDNNNNNSSSIDEAEEDDNNLNKRKKRKTKGNTVRTVVLHKPFRSIYGEDITCVTALKHKHLKDTIACGSDNLVVLLRVTDPNHRDEMDGHTNMVLQVRELDEDTGELVSISYDSEVRIWDTTSLTCTRCLAFNSKDPVLFRNFSLMLPSKRGVPPSRELYLFDRYTVANELIDLQTLKFSNFFTPIVVTAATHPNNDGRVVFSSSDRKIRGFRGDARHTLQYVCGTVKTEYATSLCLLKDGTTLVTGNQNGTISVWQLFSS